MAIYDPIVSVKADKYYLRVLAGDRVTAGFWFKKKEEMEKFADALKQAVALAPVIEEDDDKED